MEKSNSPIPCDYLYFHVKGLSVKDLEDKILALLLTNLENLLLLFVA